jgi:predicted HTH transcriptional regulator
MPKEHPDVWTEAAFLELPLKEDDRYEWKAAPKKVLDNLGEFRKMLSKQIGALANSFGGTLFIGIDNDRLIEGVAKEYIGRQSLKDWLEGVIPTLFELRLHNLRVSEMVLSPETALRIGTEKAVIVIDVFESDLAPHQSTTDHHYYYRVAGTSKPAPHHYLAFLWGRTNPKSGACGECVVHALFKRPDSVL